MLQLETETKARVRAMMLSRGMDVKEASEFGDAGMATAEGTKGKSWVGPPCQNFARHPKNSAPR